MGFKMEEQQYLSTERLAKKMSKALDKSRKDYQKFSNKPVSSEQSFQLLFQEMEFSCNQLKNNNHCSKPTLLVVGKTGSGKSSLINTLLGKHLSEVGTGPQTGIPRVIDTEDFTGTEIGRFLDTPGWSTEGGITPKELRKGRSGRRNGKRKSAFPSLERTLIEYRPDGIIYCVTPSTLNSLEILVDLQRLTEIKNQVDTITGVTSSLLVVMTKADSDLGPHVEKGSEEHFKVTKRRLKFIRETISNFQQIHSPDQNSPEIVSICSCIAKYKLRIGNSPDFSSCDVTEVKERLVRPESEFLKSIHKAHLDALEELRISTAHCVIWNYSLLNKMLSLLSVIGPPFPGKSSSLVDQNRNVRYKADFSVVSHFVTALRLVGLIGTILLAYRPSGYLFLSPPTILVLTVVLGGLVNGLTTLNVGYNALKDFTSSTSLTSTVISKLRHRYPNRPSYTPLATVPYPPSSSSSTSAPDFPVALQTKPFKKPKDY